MVIGVMPLEYKGGTGVVDSHMTETEYFICPNNVPFNIKYGYGDKRQGKKCVTVVIKEEISVEECLRYLFNIFGII